MHFSSRIWHLVGGQHFGTFRILTAFKWNTSRFQHFWRQDTGHVKLTKYINSNVILTHFREVEVVNRAVTIFDFNRWMIDSPIQIMIYEIRHFSLMTELLTLHFFASLFGGTLTVSPFPLILTSFGGTAFTRVPRYPSTTPLATAVIFIFKNHHISTIPTWPFSEFKNLLNTYLKYYLNN